MCNFQVVLVLSLVCLNRVSFSPSWPPIPHVAKAGLEVLAAQFLGLQGLQAHTATFSS